MSRRTCTIAALSGARNITYGGLLGIDKIFSPEQLIIDLEIVDYVKHVARGAEFSEEALGLEALRDVGPGGNFLTHPSTLSRYRGLWSSGLFGNLSPEQWSARLGTTLRERVRERIRELLDSYDYQPDPGLVREVDRIYHAAEEALA